jgi:hypothetical protein
LRVMDLRCERHGFELAVDTCRNCGNSFCAECVVYSFGRKQQPYCVACALAAAGVRSNAARQPTMSRKEMRRQAKERKKTEKDRKAAKAVQSVEIDWTIPVDDPAAPNEFEWADEQEATGERVPF